MIEIDGEGTQYQVRSWNGSVWSADATPQMWDKPQEAIDCRARFIRDYPQFESRIFTFVSTIFDGSTNEEFTVKHL
jgi:hypothetical protein